MTKVKKMFVETMQEHYEDVEAEFNKLLFAQKHEPVEILIREAIVNVAMVYAPDKPGRRIKLVA